MLFRRFYKAGSILFSRSPLLILKQSCNSESRTNAAFVLCKHLDISESEAEYIAVKQPIVKKISDDRMKSIVEVIYTLGFPKKVLIEHPALLGILPITLKFRYKVLDECGVYNITPSHLLTYLTLIRTKSVEELKERGEISSFVNVVTRLASYMTQWPSSLTTLINEDTNKATLFTLRLKIIQRYLELVLELSEEEFNGGVQTYPTIKHRPLQVINETMAVLQSECLLPIEKIKSNFYLVHADPENLKNILYRVKSLGGIDIKEIIRLYPKLAMKNYNTLLDITKVLKEHYISDEAIRRCFPVYTLSPETIRERLEKAKAIPEFQTYINHPRYLKIILYHKRAMERLRILYSINKKCSSINILSGSSEHYKAFEKAPGDSLRKGRDLIFCISNCLDNVYSKNKIKKAIGRHPFHINVPLVQIRFVNDKLRKNFSVEDIYQNCPILFYPWSKVRDVLKIINNNKKLTLIPNFQDNIDLNKLNNLQKLSLALYLLEKPHYFSGNGVWLTEKTDHLYTETNKLNVS